MSADKRKVSSKNTDPGFMVGLTRQVRLVLRLMADSRVSPLAKILPIGSLIYLISPFDFPTPIDDAVVIGAGTYMFFQLCPPDVVAEHRNALWGEEADGGDVVDAEYSDAGGDG